MRRTAIAVAVLVVAGGLVQAALGKHRRGGITGVVENTTCLGPCRSPSPPPPAYSGDSLTVEVHRLGDGALVAVRHPTDGRFAIKLKRGGYEVRASVSDPCWAGDQTRVAVRSGKFTRLALQVANHCIL